jgi:hypothetical protein
MAKRGRPFAYQSENEKPVTVSVRLPREVYTQVERYVKRYPGMTLTEFMLDGIRLRLDTPADPRDILLSDDNTVMQEVQEMIRAAVQREVGKLSAFMPPHVSTPGSTPVREEPAEPMADLSYYDNTILREIEEAAPQDAPSISSDDNTVLQENTSRRPGRRSTLRQPIIDLLREHPQGLTAVQMKVHLGVTKNIGDTLAGMVRDGLLAKQGSGNAVWYVVRESL